MNDFSKPTKIDDATRAYPANVKHLMPTYEEIPKEFKNFNTRGGWVSWQMKWFFEGLKKEEVPNAKEGIDCNEAMRHLAAIQGSFEPKHEHKAAAVAYLASLWFEEVPKSVKGGEK
jgi:hypothetical protein